jgi:hypothetical protein
MAHFDLEILMLHVKGISCLLCTEEYIPSGREDEGQSLRQLIEEEVATATSELRAIFFDLNRGLIYSRTVWMFHDAVFVERTELRMRWVD